MPEAPQLRSGRLRVQTQVFRLEDHCMMMPLSGLLSFFEVVFLKSVSLSLLLEKFGVFWALKSMLHSHLVSLDFFPDFLLGFSAISTLTSTQAPIRQVSWGPQNALGRDEPFSARLKASAFPKSYTYTVPVKSHSSSTR